MSEAEIIAVTGAGGFLGQHIIKDLKECDIRIIEIDIKSGIDILSLSALKNIPAFNTMIHLAAKTYIPDSYSDSLGFYQTNILGTLNCLELCKKYHADIIFASSYVYGKPKYLPVDENHPTSSWNPYATSKLIGEQLCASYSHDFGINSYILRIFNIYGPNQDEHFLLPTIINGIMNRKLSLQSPYPKRDFVYVLDVVEAILLCTQLKRKGINIYNVGTGKSFSVSEVVDLVKDILNSDLKVNYRNFERKAEIENAVADISKIKKDLGWFPKFDLKSGLLHIMREFSGG